MNFLIRWIQRLVIGVMAVGVIWLISTQIYERLDDRLPAFMALVVTYFVSAYVVLPLAIHLTILITKKGRIPRFIRAMDGMYVDPVNVVLIGNKNDLEKAFAKIGWHGVDKSNLKSAIKMGVAFLFNRPYARAPFGWLFLFGRKQDLGFQLAIGKSPRKRHHVRFWATNTEKIEDLSEVEFWFRRQKIKRDEAFAWIGSASEDVGLGFKKLTYQMTHKVNKDIDKERDFLLSELKKSGCVGKIEYYNPGAFKIGKYVSDGKIAVGRLKG